MQWSRRDLTLIGASLYLGEGTKARTLRRGGTIYAIEFTNTDMRMIRLFMLFLRKIIVPVEHRVKAQLFLYKDHDVDRERRYWSLLTDIPTNRFQKDIILRQSSGRFHPSMHGTIKIRYSHKTHFLKLQGIIDKVFGGVA
jgi:hypothetical protein